MKAFVIGDIHNNYKGLVQVLERSNFNKEKDLLITLGDIVDSVISIEAPQVVEELLTIKNRIDIVGNHDNWCKQWMDTTIANYGWLSQGGSKTKEGYEYYPELIDKHNKEFFSKQVYYHIDDVNRVFVHGGFNHKLPVTIQDSTELMWNRGLWGNAVYWQFNHDTRKQKLEKVQDYEEVFIGHTTTLHSVSGKFNNYLPSDKPVHCSNVYNLDTGSGSSGKLTIMNVDTKEYFQSDLLKDLYIKG